MKSAIDELPARLRNAVYNAETTEMPLRTKQQLASAITSGRFQGLKRRGIGKVGWEVLLRWSGILHGQKWAYHRDRDGGFIGREDAQTQLCYFREGMGDKYGEVIAEALNRAEMKRTWHFKGEAQ